MYTKLLFIGTFIVHNVIVDALDKSSGFDYFSRLNLEISIYFPFCTV